MALVGFLAQGADQIGGLVSVWPSSLLFDSSGR